MNLSTNILEFALDTMHSAGQMTLGWFQTGVDVERKGDSSPVTIADKSAEQYIRAAIRKAFPEHGIIGEEYGRENEGARYQWIVDPIDGTKSFIHGVPLYGSLLALTDTQAPAAEASLLGIANFPALGEMVYATRGGGCWLNGRRVRATTTSSLAEATFLFSDVVGYGKRLDVWQTLVERTRVKRTWGDSYGYALVATGRADIMLDPIMNVWDSAPFGVILPEAGGTFTNWQGEPTIYDRSTVATNGILLDSVLGVTRG
jgi:histidinol-phosphatase